MNNELKYVEYDLHSHRHALNEVIDENLNNQEITINSQEKKNYDHHNYAMVLAF